PRLTDRRPSGASVLAGHPPRPHRPSASPPGPTVVPCPAPAPSRKVRSAGPSTYHGEAIRSRGDHRPMPHVATSPADLLANLHGTAHLDDDLLVIDDEAAFRGSGIRDLAWTAAFSTDDATTEAAQWLVWEASQELGAQSASIQELYS